jgi:hypothetical protein
MKKLLLSGMLISMSVALMAQSQAETYINEALGYVKAKNYKQAQMSLQDAINEINNALAQDVLNQLPAEVNGLKASKNDDNTNSAAMGMMGGGMSISRKYATDDNKQTAEINIIANSPLVSSMTMFLNNPAMMNASGGNQKSVRVGTKRAMLKKESNTETDENGKEMQKQNFELSVVLGQTLVTVKGDGFANEQAFTAFYSKIDFDKISKALGEN